MTFDLRSWNDAKQAENPDTTTREVGNESNLSTANSSVISAEHKAWQNNWDDYERYEEPFTDDENEITDRGTLKLQIGNNPFDVAVYVKWHEDANSGRVIRAQGNMANYVVRVHLGDAPASLFEDFETILTKLAQASDGQVQPSRGTGKNQFEFDDYQSATKFATTIKSELQSFAVSRETANEKTQPISETNNTNETIDSWTDEIIFAAGRTGVTVPTADGIIRVTRTSERFRSYTISYEPETKLSDAEKQALTDKIENEIAKTGYILTQGSRIGSTRNPKPMTFVSDPFNYGYNYTPDEARKRGLKQTKNFVKKLKEAVDEGKLSDKLLNNNTATKSSLRGSGDTSRENVVEPRTEQQRILQRLGQDIGQRVVFFDNPNKDFHGAHVGNTTFINVNSEFALPQVFWHETAHWLKVSNPELYRRLVKAAGITDAQRKAYLEETQRTDIKTNAEIDEEIIADQLEDVMKRAGFLRDIGRKDQNLIERLIAWLQDMFSKFREYFQNPQGKLTRAQAQRMANEFGRMAKDIVNQRGEKIFRYNTKTHTTELATGEKLSNLYRTSNQLDGGRRASTTTVAQFGGKIVNGKPVFDNARDEADYQHYVKAERLGEVKLSMSHPAPPIDFLQRFDDNESAIDQKVFDEYLNEGIMKIVSETVEEEIGEYIDLSKMNDPVARDEARDKLPSIRKMLVWYNQNTVQNNSAYKDRLAVRIEYARRCFDNDERIKTEVVRQTDGNYRQRREHRPGEEIISGNVTGRDNGNSGRITRGVSRSVSGGKSDARKHFLKLYDEMAKRSEQQGSFSSGKTKFAGNDELARHFRNATKLKPDELNGRERKWVKLGESLGVEVVWVDAHTDLKGAAAIEALKLAFPNINFDKFKTIRMILESCDALNNEERREEFKDYLLALSVKDLHNLNNANFKAQAQLKRLIE